MSLAFSWVKYNSNPQTVNGKTVFMVQNSSLPFLHLGTYAPDGTFESNRKFLLGLKFQGTGAENIKVWFDGTKCDVFPPSGGAVLFRQDWKLAPGSGGLGIDFKYTLLNAMTNPLAQSAKAATTTNISNIASSNTISNLQDGVTLQLNDRLLVKNQTTASENGVYQVSGTFANTKLAFTRSSDLNNSNEVIPNGFVTDSNASITYYLYTPTITPTLGVSSIKWIPRTSITAISARLVQTTNIPDLSNGPAYVDGTLLSVGDRILLVGQSDPTQNGIYQVQSINNASTYSLTRTTGYGTSDSFSPYTIHNIISGNYFQWYFSNWSPSTYANYLGTVSLSNSSYNNPVFTPIAQAPKYWSSCTYTVDSLENTFSSMNWATSDGAGNSEVFLGCPNMLYNYNTSTMTALVNGDTILVIGTWPGSNGTGQAYNGIYQVVTVGTGTNGVWKRSSVWNTFDISAGADNSHIVMGHVSEGSKGWLPYLPPGSLTMDITNQSFYPYLNELDSFNHHIFGPTCATYSNTNISNLASCGATINGYNLKLGDNVLITSQTSVSQNGCYTVTTAPTTVLTRTADFAAGARTDRVAVTVSAGTFATQIFDLYSPASYTVGTTAISWYERSKNTSYTACAYSSTDNVDLTSSAQSSDFSGATLTVGMRLLVNNQTDTTQNGIYTIVNQPSISLTRASDLNSTGQLLSNYRIEVTNGLTYSSNFYGIWFSGTPTLGTTSLYFIKQPSSLQFTDCSVATTANLTATYTSGILTNSGTQTALVIDGQILTTNQRVLVKDQTTHSQNGIYIVTNVGSLTTNWVLTRAGDMTDSSQIFPQATVVVDTGTVNAQSSFMINITDTPNTEPNYYTIGTSNFSWGLITPSGTFFEAPSSADWYDMPTSQGTAFSLGTATLNSNLEAYSQLFGLAASVSSGAAFGNVRNMRMIVSFDTLDS